MLIRFVQSRHSSEAAQSQPGEGWSDEVRCIFRGIFEAVFLQSVIDNKLILSFISELRAETAGRHEKYTKSWMPAKSLLSH